MRTLSPNTALIIIDMQKAIDDPVWGERNNPQLEQNIARLLAFWREAKRPVIHVRHMSREPMSTYRPGQPGNEFKPEVQPRIGEWIVEKSTNSAFIGTDLEQRLHNAGINALVITGVITNNSVEATARMAGNLGFETYVVSDGTAAFGRKDYNGMWHDAEVVHAMSLANLSGEYATIVSTAELLANDGQ